MGVKWSSSFIYPASGVLVLVLWSSAFSRCLMMYSLSLSNLDQEPDRNWSWERSCSKIEGRVQHAWGWVVHQGYRSCTNRSKRLYLFIIMNWLFQFHCCGVTGPQDYSGTAWQREVNGADSSLKLPLTCCALNSTTSKQIFLDPFPTDLDKCQNLDICSEEFRNSEVCMYKWSR